MCDGGGEVEVVLGARATATSVSLLRVEMRESTCTPTGLFLVARPHPTCCVAMCLDYDDGVQW